MSTHTHASGWPERHRLRLGGSRGNEILTSVNAAALVVLIGVQLVTVLALESMIRIHLFVGVVLLGPVLLKLGTTGYRFVRYYTGAREYRTKGPPRKLLRLTAPVFVAATVGLFASGVAMLVQGDGGGAVQGIHVASFWVWIACLALHVVFNGTEVVRHLRAEWFTRGRAPSAGTKLRAALVLSSILGGLLVALALISKIAGYDLGD